MITEKKASNNMVILTIKEFALILIVQQIMWFGNRIIADCNVSFFASCELKIRVNIGKHVHRHNITDLSKKKYTYIYEPIG